MAALCYVIVFLYTADHETQLGASFIRHGARWSNNVKRIVEELACVVLCDGCWPSWVVINLVHWWSSSQTTLSQCSDITCDRAASSISRCASQQLTL